MKEKQKKVYYCEFCGKHYFQKVFGLWHEKYCGKNPLNLHKCFEDCNNLRITDSKESEYFELEPKEFYCEKLQRNFYSYKAEAKANHPRLLQSREVFTTVVSVYERMPLECEDFNTPAPFIIDSDIEIAF